MLNTKRSDYDKNAKERIEQKTEKATEKKCKHCAMMIPQEAKICPHCRKRLNTHPFTMAVLYFFVFVLFLGIFSAIKNKGGGGSSPVTVPVVDKKMQAERADYIAKITEAGVIEKIDNSGSLPHVWVRPLFHTLKFELKETAIGVIYAYYYPSKPADGLVILNDNLTGKIIGKYSPTYGGLKLD